MLSLIQVYGTVEGLPFIKLFNFLDFSGLQEVVIVFFQKLIDLITNKNYATIYSIPMHLVSHIKSFILYFS